MIFVAVLQGTLPCLTESGEVILDTPSSVATAPDGNGGLYTALQRSVALPDFAGILVIYLKYEFLGLPTQIPHTDAMKSQSVDLPCCAATLLASRHMAFGATSCWV